MSYINFDSLPRDLRQFVLDYIDCPNIIERSDGEQFAKAYAILLPDAFEEMVSEKLDCEEMVQHAANAGYTRSNYAVFARIFEVHVNCLFRDELKELVNEQIDQDNGYKDEGSENRRLFEATESRDINKSF